MSRTESKWKKWIGVLHLAGISGLQCNYYYFFKSYCEHSAKRDEFTDDIYNYVATENVTFAWQLIGFPEALSIFNNIEETLSSGGKGCFEKNKN